MLQILKDKPILQNFFLSLSNNKEFYLTNKILSVCESQNKLKSHKTKVKINEANYVRTEEEDINNIFYLSPQSTKMKSSYENLKNLKRNGVFGNLKSFHRNGGLLRGKLCEKIEDNYIEVNSIKTKNQKILDILSKNLGSQHKDPQSIFSHGFSDHSHHKSMIRSPFNKYNFIKIDILERKVIKTSDKKTKVPLLNKSEDGVSRLQRRIQSAMPTRGTSSHQRTQSNSIYQKKTVGGFITNSTQITRVHTRCQSSKGFVENGGKIENELINFCNLAVKKEGEKKDGIIHENMNVGKRRSLASSIHKTKHNMFYFTKKS